MPRRERRSDDSRVMSSPAYVTLPADAARSPESTLISVVFPAPLGPTTACSLPSSSAIETSLTAARPPKWRVRPRVASSGSLTVESSDERAPEATGDAGQTAGEEDHQQNDRGAEQQLPMARHRLKHFG